MQQRFSIRVMPGCNHDLESGFSTTVENTGAIQIINNMYIRSLVYICIFILIYISLSNCACYLLVVVGS